MRLLRPIVTIPVVLVLVACGGSPELAEVPAAPTVPEPTATLACAVEAAAFVDQVQPLAREWDDATKLADNTPRMSLSPQIANLQAIRRRTVDLQVPECARTVQARLVASMDSTINAFLDFLGQKPDATVSQSFEAARLSFEAYEDELARLTGQPAPFRTPTPQPTLTPAPTNTPIPTVSVDLRVGGSTKFAWIGHTTSGPTEPTISFPVPWSVLSDVQVGQTVTLVARNAMREGTVTCEIWLNRERVAFQETSEPEGSVTCSASVPLP